MVVNGKLQSDTGLLVVQNINKYLTAGFGATQEVQRSAQHGRNLLKAVVTGPDSGRQPSYKIRHSYLVVNLLLEHRYMLIR
jgi:hypothetical protein